MSLYRVCQIQFAWSPELCVCLSCGQGIHRPDERQSPSPWVEKAALQTWDSVSLWRLLVHPSFPWVHLPEFPLAGKQSKGGGSVIAFDSKYVLSSVPEWPAEFLALLTWLFYFWVEGLHLILQSESWFYSTDTFAWMETSNLGEQKTYGFWFLPNVFCSKLWKYENQGMKIKAILYLLSL